MGLLPIEYCNQKRQLYKGIVRSDNSARQKAVVLEAVALEATALEVVALEAE